MNAKTAPTILRSLFFFLMLIAVGSSLINVSEAIASETEGTCAIILLKEDVIEPEKNQTTDFSSSTAKGLAPAEDDQTHARKPMMAQTKDVLTGAVGALSLLCITALGALLARHKRLTTTLKTAYKLFGKE